MYIIYLFKLVFFKSHILISWDPNKGRFVCIQRETCWPSESCRSGASWLTCGLILQCNYLWTLNAAFIIIMYAHRLRCRFARARLVPMMFYCNSVSELAACSLSRNTQTRPPPWCPIVHVVNAHPTTRGFQVHIDWVVHLFKQLVVWTLNLWHIIVT